MKNLQIPKNYYFFNWCMIFLITLSYSGRAQVSIGGIPKSFNYNTITPIPKIPFVTMPTFSVDSMLKEDSINIGKPLPLRFAKGFEVNYSLENSGLWETLANGDKIWRLGIHSTGAYAINILFGDYEIHDRATVFIYNSKKSHIIGAFTSNNNSASNILSTMPITTDSIIVEYYEPLNTLTHGKLTISNIGHDYKGVTQEGCYSQPQGGSCYKNSLCPEVDVICNANFQNGVI